MSFTILFHPEVAGDIALLPALMKERVKKAIAKRLMTEPALYGKPLRATLKGYWKLRVGDYRVVYSVQASEVVIYVVRHRKEVYPMAAKRLNP
jgi:mRNA interferase RelE/StbE